MPRSDTSPEVRRRQIDAHRSLSADERMALGIDLSESMRKVKIDGIRSRHREFDDREIAEELFRIWHGLDVLALSIPSE